MATMQDVARRAGVSLSTVSYAINNTRPISPATRERIEAAMAELGYRRNAMARSLASRRSRTLALVLPASENPLGGTLSEISTLAAREARARDYHLTIWPGLGSEHDDAGQLRDLALQGLADGAIFLEVSLDDVRVAAVEEAGFPAVLIGRPERTAGRFCVDIDFDETVQRAVAHLAELGHRRIGFVNHSAASFDRRYGPTVRSFAAYERAMAELGEGANHEFADESADGGRRAVERMLARDADLTAIILMNELAGFGVVASALRLGLRVPTDLSVLGIVTSPGIGALVEPRLTTLAVPTAELARTAVTTLIDHLESEQEPGAPVLVACELVPGASTAPPSKERPA